MKVLQLTVHFSPNIGGVETHLSNLIEVLIKRGFNVDVLTYQPLTTNVSWKIFEKNKNLTIIRIPWIPGLFYKLVSFPMLEFLYLLPGLFFMTPLILIWKNPDVIHAHGLIAGFVGVFWGKLFGSRVVVSTHSIYSFPNKGLYKSFAKWIFAHADKSLGLSKQAIKEIESLGISTKKVDSFIYWIDPDLFKKVTNAKKILGWKDKFVVLFVGRLVEEKGVIELLQSAKTWHSNITLIIVGSGPLEEKVRQIMSKNKNIRFVGTISQDQLPTFYCASDILIVPSVSEEGFGRVILEALSCGLPVIGSNRGAIPEAMDETVGQIIDITVESIKEAVEYFYNHREKLEKLAKNCRKFAERRYSEKNVENIIKAYTG